MPSSCVACSGACSPNGTPFPTCSLRCAWSQSNRCVQCGRDRASAASQQQPVMKPFCGALCQDEARRGNWCVGCGVRQVPQGSARCGSENCCSSANNDSAAAPAASSSAAAPYPGTEVDAIVIGESPFPSRRTSPNDNVKPSRHQQQQRTYDLLEPGHKLWDRIVTPFHRYGKTVHRVLQLQTPSADKKAYNANRLAVDSRMSANRIAKYGLGGEGNEHKRFVPLLAGCDSHLRGSGAPTDGNSNNTPCCADPSCDVCRVVSGGMKLSSMAGRNSHFSVPTLESVLPWCSDASSTTPDGSLTFSAVALVRVVVGNAYVVQDLSQVAAPPIGYDSVVLPVPNNNNHDQDAPNDQIFSFSDYNVQPEYIVLFSEPSSQPHQQYH